MKDETELAVKPKSFLELAADIDQCYKDINSAKEEKRKHSSALTEADNRIIALERACKELKERLFNFHE